MAFKGLFIGIDRYAPPEINWLSCASRDARALHALSTDTLGGETALLTDEQATVAAIEEPSAQIPWQNTMLGFVCVILLSLVAPHVESAIASVYTISHPRINFAKSTA